MKKLILGLGFIFLTSCSKTTVFPPLGKVTSIEIVGPTASTFPFKSKVRKITNGAHIAKIVSFVDSRQSGWHSPYYTMPMAETILVFYNGKTKKRIFGIGTNFFSDQIKLKNISRQEKQELLDLIGAPLPAPNVAGR